MPKNKKGGKAFKKGKKNPEVTRRMEYAEEANGEVYGLVDKALGNACFEVKCYDGKDRRCKVKGNMRGKRKVWINVGDTVIICKDECNSSRDTGHIVHKYKDNEVKRLRLQMPGQVENDDHSIEFGFCDDDEVDNTTKKVDIIKPKDDSDDDFDIDAI